MGYYVSITGADFRVPAENIDAAFEAVKMLNARHDLKNGRRWPANSVKPADSLSLGDPNIWFAWMDWDYDVSLDSLAAVLDELGFEIEQAEDGLYLTGYDNKIGNEDEFLKVLAPYAREGSYLNWLGEDGAMYRHEVRDGSLVTLNAEVSWKED